MTLIEQCDDFISLLEACHMASNGFDYASPIRTWDNGKGLAEWIASSRDQNVPVVQRCSVHYRQTISVTGRTSRISELTLHQNVFVANFGHSSVVVEFEIVQSTLASDFPLLHRSHSRE